MAVTSLTSKIAAHIDEILALLGEDKQRCGLAQTPQRVAETLQFLTQGQHQALSSIANGAIFPNDSDQMVVVKHIELYSLCEHHLLPFFGRCHIAYLPDRKIIGLSKLARVVELFARRLQIQEQLTQQIAEAIDETLAPKGVAVICECQHLCMMMRGVGKQQATMNTTTMLGIFKQDASIRQQFFDLIRT